ncbi:hypothetical protein NQ317_012219 [Molorchus minor]|uniref:SET domain-containing protein n=1 Tax=Molorchus minor TaxID=1323400 RepID=A0ABQ9IR91_9CUCU|nr:hypothetical protein NQ317_012219 [Molorchus minor]
MFGAKKDLDAIKLYTESIAYAENGSSHLGLAYANRSAVLFENRYYEECLKDISRALKNNYPQNLLKKIVGRQKRAESLRGANKRSISYCDPPPDIPNRNPHIASASSCVELKRNSVFGTHIVTTRDVKAGEVLSVENPYEELHTFFKTYDDVINTTILFFNAAHAKEIYYNIKDHTTLLQKLNMKAKLKLQSLYIYCNFIISLIASIEIHEDKDGVNEPFSGGIYSFLSRYNHSCAPNCKQTYHGKTVAVRAFKDIKKGEQCFISYGP